MSARQILFALLACAALMFGSDAAAERPSPAGTLRLDLAASNSDAFIDEWVRTPASHAPILPRQHETVPGKNFYVAFIVSGHLHDAAGRSQLEIDWVMRRPDGTVDNAQRAYAQLRGRECGRPGFAMADPALTYGFEPTDPAGLWRLEVTARDRLNDKRVTESYAIMLRK